MLKTRVFAAIFALLCAPAALTSSAWAQAAQVPNGEQCFQATTGVNGMVGVLGAITPGSGGTAGTYVSISLTGGTGSGATANITVSGGVTQVVILNPGVNYSVGDALSATSGNIGGVTGFSVPVNSISINSALAGGQVDMYLPGTLTYSQTWQDAAQTIQNTNPIQLDSNGCAVIYGVGTYRQIVYDSLGNAVWDKLTSVVTNYVWGATAAGTANALTATASGFASIDGQQLGFIPSITNTGPATIAVNGGSPISVDQGSSAGPVALSAGALVAGNAYTVTYSASTGAFQLTSSSSAQAQSFQQPDPGATARTMQAHAQDWIDVLDYLPVGQPNGTSDNSTGVQLAFTSICARNAALSPIFSTAGGTVNFPAGHYLAQGITVTCGGVKIVGSGGGNPGFGTVWDFSAAPSVTGFGLRFQPSGYPLTTPQQALYGDGVDGVQFYSQNNIFGTYALDFQGVSASWARNINFSGNIYNAIRIYGGFKVTLDDITGEIKNGSAGISNYGIEIAGDLRGETSSGAGCTLGDCSTRTDVPRMHNIDFEGQSSLTCVYIHGLVATTVGEHVTCETSLRGLDIECPTGFPSLSYCPEFTEFTDFEAEGFSDEGARLFDQTDFQCIGCFFYGIGAAANHAVDAQYLNYAQAGGAGGGVRLTGGTYGNSGGSGIYIAMSDSKVVGTHIQDANLANIGAAGIEIGGQNQHLISGNTFCAVFGATSPSMAAVLLDNGGALPVSGTTVVDNFFFHCTSGVNDSSAGPTVIANNQGP